jgi:hypothetical protein
LVVGVEQQGDDHHEAGSIDAAMTVNQDRVFGLIEDLDQLADGVGGRKPIGGAAQVFHGDVELAQGACLLLIPGHGIATAAQVDHGADAVPFDHAFQAVGGKPGTAVHQPWYRLPEIGPEQGVTQFQNHRQYQPYQAAPEQVR